MRPTRREARGAAGPVVEFTEVVVRLPRATAARAARLYPGSRLDGVLVLALGEHLDAIDPRTPTHARG